MLNNYFYLCDFDWFDMVSGWLRYTNRFALSAKLLCSWECFVSSTPYELFFPIMST